MVESNNHTLTGSQMTKRVKKEKPKPTTGHKLSFKKDEYIVYPSHGVGLVTNTEKQTVEGRSYKFLVIRFDQEKMTLRVPVDNISAVGLRKLSDTDQITQSLEILKGRAKAKRAMWSRRAQEYESKINSGSLESVAEVVRDLFRDENKGEQSYSERQIYETARGRMAKEVSVVKNISNDEAISEIEHILKSKKKVKSKGESKDSPNPTTVDPSGEDMVSAETPA